MPKYKDREDNPLHKDFGIWSNTKFIIRKIRQYCPSLIWLALLGVVCGSIPSYAWGIIGKYVIDVIGQGIGQEEKVQQLIRIIMISGCVILLLNVGNSVSTSRTWHRMFEAQAKYYR